MKLFKLKRRIYRVMNIESGNFSFDEEDRAKYCPEIYFTHSGKAYYKIGATIFQYIILKIRFWKMRWTIGSAVTIVPGYDD